jgi:hypothetical protein
VGHFEKIRETIHGEPDLVLGSANIYGKLGDVESGFNEESKSVRETNRTRLNEARSWYQKSIEALAGLRELGSDGVEIQKSLAATEDKLAQCVRQLK